MTPYAPWTYVDLSNGGFALVEEADLPLVESHTWRHKREGRCIYAITNGPGGTRPRMHRLILGAEDGQLVDHINGNGLDNRRWNLRIVTNRQNQQNRHASSGATSQFKGVTWHRQAKRWQAQIKINGKATYLGLFEDERLAGAAYDAAALKHFGEYAVLNFHAEGRRSA